MAKADSRIKRYSRWIQNERIEYEGFYLPFVSELLAHLAQIRELVFVIDGSEVGHECITLMISLIYGKRALPITWLVVKGCKGHLPEERSSGFTLPITGDLARKLSRGVSGRWRI